jgi:hypothetical protein
LPSCCCCCCCCCCCSGFNGAYRSGEHRPCCCAACCCCASALATCGAVLAGAAGRALLGLPRGCACALPAHAPAAAAARPADSRLAPLGCSGLPARAACCLTGLALLLLLCLRCSALAGDASAPLLPPPLAAAWLAAGDTLLLRWPCSSAYVRCRCCLRCGMGFSVAHQLQRQGPAASCCLGRCGMAAILQQAPPRLSRMAC